MNVQSSLIATADYNAESEILALQFHNAAESWSYVGVSRERWERFQAAGSKGKFFLSEIKPYFVPYSEKPQALNTPVATPVYLALLQTKKFLKSNPGSTVRFAVFGACRVVASGKQAEALTKECLRLLNKERPTVADIDDAITAQKR